MNDQAEERKKVDIKTYVKGLEKRLTSLETERDKSRLLLHIACAGCAVSLILVVVLFFFIPTSNSKETASDIQVLQDGLILAWKDIHALKKTVVPLNSMEAYFTDIVYPYIDKAIVNFAKTMDKIGQGVVTFDALNKHLNNVVYPHIKKTFDAAGSTGLTTEIMDTYFQSTVYPYIDKKDALILDAAKKQYALTDKYMEEHKEFALKRLQDHMDFALKRHNESVEFSNDRRDELMGYINQSIRNINRLHGLK